ncbi:unnamed protein product [Ixodes hexagonus]
MARLRGRGVRKQAVRAAKEATTTSDQEASDREGSDGEESDSGAPPRRQLRNGRRTRSPPPEESRTTRRSRRQRKAEDDDVPDEGAKQEDSSDTERDGSPPVERRSPEKAAEEDPNGKVAADEEPSSSPLWKETLVTKVLNLSSDSSSDVEVERVGRRTLVARPASVPRSSPPASPDAAPQEEQCERPTSPLPAEEANSQEDVKDGGEAEVTAEDKAGRRESEEPAKENSTSQDVEMKVREAPRSISPPKFKARRISTAALKRETGEKEDKPQRKRRWGSTNVVVGPSVSISSSALKAITQSLTPALPQDLIPDIEPVASKAKDPEEPLASVPEEPATPAETPAADQEDGCVAEPAEASDEPPVKVQAVAAKEPQPKEAKPAAEDRHPVSERKPIHALADRAPLSKRAAILPKEECVRRQPSPPKHPKTRTLFVRNLVRPFTLNQLKQLLSEFGETVDSEFWIDKIKSKCFVTYATEEEAATAREALHNLRWPLCNPKILHIDFSTPEEMARQKEPPAPRIPASLPAPALPMAPAMLPMGPDRLAAAPAFHRTVEVEPRPLGRDARELRDARDPRDVRGLRDARDVRDIRDIRDAREPRDVREGRDSRDPRDVRSDPREVREAERQAPQAAAAAPQASRRAQAPVREWDRDKLRQETPPQERPRGPSGAAQSRGTKEAKDRAHTPDKKERRDKKVAKRKQEDTPAKLLDDLFRKTKATPCIYWLPLTDDQIAHKEEERKQRRMERERRRQQQQLQEEEDRRKRALARDLDSKARDSKRASSHSPVRRR